MKKITKIMAFALAGSMMLSFAACSSKGSTRNHTADKAEIASGAYADYEPAEYYEETVAQANMGDYYDEAGLEMSNAVSGDRTATPDTTTSQYPANTMLIRRVSMNVETTNYNSVTNSISAKVAELGGYIESSNANGTGKSGDLRNITYVIRVPIDKLDEIINTVGQSCTVLSSNENTEDVTLQYSDIQSRIRSLRVEQDTLLELLAQAESLDAIITLQNRLTEVRYEIESYESRARVLENQSSYSTLSLNIREVLEETEQEEPKKLTFGEEILEGLTDSLSDIKEDSMNFVIGFVSALPYLLIFALFAFVVFLIVKGSIKSAKKKSAKKKALKAAAEAAATAATPAVPEETKKETSGDKKEE